jgi:UDP-N-acetylglucosamine diphosphorylase/glucosamine-1-phosphate N-acetyltransferase
MKNIILFDSDVRDRLLPLTFTRPVAELRIGILTIREKWEKYLGGTVSYITQDYLSTKFPIHIEEDNYVINGAVLPNENLCRLITSLKPNEALLDNGELIAARLDEEQFGLMQNEEEFKELVGLELEGLPFLKINYPWDLFRLNDEVLRSDFDFLTKGRKSQPVSLTNRIIGGENIFLEEGAKVECAILNASTGPIYLGKNAEIMEGSIVRGALALCEESTLKLGTKIYGATTIGPHSKVGGEVSNAVILGYSNKAHDGYLGNSVLGEWCNLGAGTDTSNLKNNYASVKLWDYTAERFVNTGLQFCGLIMGDHSKCAIGTTFNTGTVVGVSSNIFGAGFPRNFIPSFAWGGGEGYMTFKTNKAFEVAEKVVGRRGLTLSDDDKDILTHIFEQSAKYRTWEASPKSPPKEGTF